MTVQSEKGRSRKGAWIEIEQTACTDALELSLP